MTWENETVRLQYHKMSTKTQVMWAEADKILESHNARIHIIAIQMDSEDSEDKLLVTIKTY